MNKNCLNENKGKLQDRLFEITAKAVVIKDGKVLILKRPNNDITNPDKYDLPGGSIEKGEKIADGLKREIKEETNLEVEIGPVVHIFDFERDYFLDKEKKEKVFLQSKGVRMLAYYRSGEVAICDEHQSYEWLDLDVAIRKLENEGFEKDKREAIIKAKEYLLGSQALDSWKRCQADFENYKKRQAENLKDAYRYASEGIIAEILPVLDNFYASTEHIPEDQKNSPWVTGIMHIQKQLEKVLENNNVAEIEIKKGDKFDPEMMEAIYQETRNKEQGTEEECKNTVKQVVTRGYKIGGKVLRAARVIVE